MLPWIAGAVIVGVGAYLYDEAMSDNERAKRAYDNACDQAEKWTAHRAKHAQKKNSLDQLFKVKRAKRKIADDIYNEYQCVQKDFKTINANLKASKEILAELFAKKRASDNRDQKRALQEDINLLQMARKELFTTKDIIQNHLKLLREHLQQANSETRRVQQEINRVLNR